MKIILDFAAAIAVVFFSLSAYADPTDARAYCAIHQNYQGPGKESIEALPADVRASRGTFWRCSGGEAMVCYGGASGSACAPTRGLDARKANWHALK